MKFVFTAAGMQEVATPSFLEKAHEKFQDFSDYVIGKEMDSIINPFLNFLQDCFVNFGHWFVANLPDFMGYSTVLCGICIIICSFAGSKTIIKPIGLWAVANIIAICILGGA